MQSQPPPLRKRLLAVVTMLAGALLPVPPAVAQVLPEGGELPFLTLRNRTGATTPGQYYGDARSDLKAGWCEVRALDLELLSPLAETVPGFIQEELLRVGRLVETAPSAVLDALEDSAGDAPPLLYTHGYFISFEKGCRRAHLLQRNAGQTGHFLWFSWPSDGMLTNYTHDEADLYWSVPDLADAIIEAHRRFGDGRVNVAGHSLGARGLVLALAEVAHRDPSLRLGQVVLLAPDMDFGIFQRVLPRVAPLARNITVYVTSGDRPLALSAQLHGYPRLGEAGNDVSTLTGVEVIDLSGLPASGPTGHLYHIYSRDVGADLDQLLNGDKPAAARQNLVRIGKNSWRLTPASDPDR